MTEQPETCDIPIWDCGHRVKCGRTFADGECPRHGRHGGGYARALIEDYFRRKDQPGAQHLDAWYQYEVTMLTDMLTRLEIILDDEGIDPGTAREVVRCMLYGSPSPAAAEQRMRQEAEMVKILNERPPSMHITGIDPGALAKLGLPPL